MSHHHRFATVCTFGLAAVLCGNERTLKYGKAEPPSEGGFHPVLKADDDAKTIVSKAIKAHCGERASARWRCGYVKYTTKGGVVPAAVGEVTVEDTFQFPGHFKRIARTEVGGKEMPVIYVLNHGKGWSKKGNAPAEPIDSRFTESTQHPFGGYSDLSLLTRSDVPLTKLGVEAINGKEAIGIRARSDKIGERDYFFASQSGLLLKSKVTVSGPEGTKPHVMESMFSDHKEVQGVPVPMRRKGTLDGEANLDLTLIEVRFADKFDESTFAKP